jgi:hypothetical protein
LGLKTHATQTAKGLQAKNTSSNGNMLVKISVLAAAGGVAVWAKAGEINIAKPIR